eukprot:Skav205229  [mRNA]  locus=scaffold1794:99087:99863:+ [translate_table: standard]
MVIDLLKKVKDKHGRPYYKLHAAILNSLNHGVAQSRGRLYIVGVHEPVRDFKWPEPQPVVPLDSALDEPHGDSGRPEWPTSKTELRNLLFFYKHLTSQGMARKCNAIGDMGVSAKWCKPGAISFGHAPCLTKSRCQSNGYWLFSRQRRLRLSEYFRLQGIDPARIKPSAAVSETQLRAMVGNSFTVPLVAKIMDRLFFCAGLTSQPISHVAGTVWTDSSCDRFIESGKYPLYSCRIGDGKKDEAICVTSCKSFFSAKL